MTNGKKLKISQKTLAKLKQQEYNELIYLHRGFMRIFGFKEPPSSADISEQKRQFRKLITSVIEYTGWRKAMTNHALGWNLAAETAFSR